MLFSNFWCKPLKADPSREVCTYATRRKPKHPDKPIKIFQNTLIPV